MTKSNARWLAPLAAAAAMAAASSAHAFTVDGVFPAPPPTSTAASVTFQLLAGSSFTAIASGSGPVVGLLYYGGAPVVPTASFSLGTQSVYGFSGLALGTYTMDLFGAAGTPWTFTVVPPYGGQVALVPEPETLALAAAGVFAMLGMTRRRLPR